LCGIIGFVGNIPEGCWGQTYRIIESLFRHVEVRGKDASGFVANAVPLDYPDRASVIAEKQPLKATEFVKLNPTFRGLAHRRCTSFVGHARAATHGEPADNRNNHPFISDDRELFLVHNGILTNHQQVADRLKLQLRTDCDSEVLLRLLETAPSVAGGIQDCLRLVSGSMALAVYDKAHDFVWLTGNGGRPLWLARLHKDRRWFFASTAEILHDSILAVIDKPSFDYFAPIPERVPLVVTTDGRCIAVDLA